MQRMPIRRHLSNSFGTYGDSTGTMDQGDKYNTSIEGI